MNIYRGVVFFIVFFSSLIVAFANNFDFIPYNSNDNLSSDRINKVFQDSEGYMWFATDNGLNRFDGYDIVVYRPDYQKVPTLNSLNITAISEDENGSIWVGSKRGLNILNKYTGEVKNIDFLEPLNQTQFEVKNILRDTDNEMWITTGNWGVFRVSLKDSNVVHYTAGRTSLGLSSGKTHSVLEDKSGRIWIGSWRGGISIYDKNKSILKKYKVHNSANIIKDIYQSSDSVIWLSLWNEGIMRVDSIRDGLIYGQKKKFEVTYTVAEDAHKRIWVATSHGLKIISNKQTLEHIDVATIGISGEELYNDIIFDLYKDYAGNMWVASKMNGLNLHNEGVNRFPHYRINDNTRTGMHGVAGFIQYNDSELMLAVPDNGFGIYDLNTKKYTSYTNLAPFKNLLPKDIRTRCFFKDSKGNLWLGSRFYGAIMIDKNMAKVSFINMDSTYKQNYISITTFIEDDKGNIWIGSEGKGLFKAVYNSLDNTYDVFHYEAGIKDGDLSGMDVNDILQDHNGDLWVATSNGLNKLISDMNQHDQVQFKVYKTIPGKKQSISSNEINEIYQDTKDRLWIATGGGGLNLYDESVDDFIISFSNYQVANISIYDIVEDKSGAFWLSSNKGLMKFYPDGAENNFEQFTIDDGLQANIYYNGSSYIGKNGDIYFGGSNGFNTFSSDLFIPDTNLKTPVISKISSNNRPVNIDLSHNDELTLPYSKNNFTIEFVSFMYASPKKSLFKYRIVELEEDWQTVDYRQRKAIYSNLIEGEYNFELIAVNSSGRWSTEPTKLKIHILPPAHRTKLAFAAYFIFLTILIYFSYKLLIKRAKLEEVLKLDQVKFRFFTNISHELLTPLSVMSYQFEELKRTVPEAKGGFVVLENNINLLSRLITQLLDYRKAETGNLKLCVEKVDIIKYVNKIGENFSVVAERNSIEYLVDCNQTNLYGFIDKDKVEKIIYNLLSNAFKYTNKGGKVTLKIRLDEKKNKIDIIVADTGIGLTKIEANRIFDRFFRVEASEVGGIGIGLALTKALVILHKGEIELKSEWNIGSEFKVSLPISEDSYRKNEFVSKDGEEAKTALIPSTEYLIKQENVDRLQATEDDLIGLADKVILIVEDNYDFRKLLVNHMQVHYKVFEAENGKQAIAMLKENEIDLIVSDVMMPEMNGFMLCEKVKSNFETSHIPIVLVTAKIQDEHRAEGYKYGADSYITKPLNTQVLDLRVSSLLNQRKQLQEYFRKTPELDKTKGKLTKLDEQFIIKFKEQIRNNLSNSNYSVNDFAEAMNTSVAVLYRKTNSLLGVTPKDYLRSYRLKQAAHMIVEENLSVSDVAFRTGFTDQGYFATCFRKEFGVPPSQYSGEKK